MSTEFDDFNDDSNAFTKTGAITIKSSSSSSGGLMAALGLSLDSDDGQLDTHTDRALQPSLPLKTQLPSGRDSVTENEQLEYDVDGDSSRPVDSHSPSLNDTSSLSSSDQKRRGSINDKTNADLPSEKQSALRDYFPLDTSFPPGAEENTAKEKPQRQHGKAISKGDGYLPKENMSHTEIVNRFLDKLTLVNPEHASGESDILQTGETEEIEQHSDIHGSQDNRMQKYTIDNRKEVNLTKASENVSKHLSSSNYVKNTGNQLHSIQEMSNNSPETFNHSGELPTASTSQSHPQQWAPHPPLNHHHPLHNRHKHHQYYSNTPIPGMQDVNSNMYTMLTSPNSLRSPLQKQPGINLPYLGSLQQQYFYTDLPSSPYSHLQQDFSQAPYQSLSTEGNPTTNLQHFYAQNDGEQHAAAQFVTSSAIPPSNPSFSASKDNNQSVHGISDWGAAGDPLTAPSGGILASPVHPAVRMPVTLSPPFGHPPPLPALTHLPPDSAAASSPSVIIPGHFTSQPISAPQVLNTAVQSSAIARSDGPADLKDMLNQLGLLKYLDKFVEQDVDLQVFLSLTDNDLKELGIK